MAQERWPGSSFKVADVLPGSVYLWACGERAACEVIQRANSAPANEGAAAAIASTVEERNSATVTSSSINTSDSATSTSSDGGNLTQTVLLPTTVAAGSPTPGGRRQTPAHAVESLPTATDTATTADAPSVSEAAAAWAVLMTQIMCYLQLWNAAVRKHPDDLEDDMDGDDDKKYSIFAVATAMYLMLSIVAADLWGAVALLVEKPHFWCGQRKLFGLFLLVSFCLLMISSTRVLLFTSLDDEELVIGAAAVLFIADVDEKLMVILKTVDRTWRLFWVLEAIGLSFSLALVAISLSKSTHAMSTTNVYGGCDILETKHTYYCWMYDVKWVLHVHPIAVTTCSVFLCRLGKCGVSMPTSVVEWVKFITLLCSWFGVESWWYSRYVSPDQTFHLSALVLGVYIVATMPWGAMARLVRSCVCSRRVAVHPRRVVFHPMRGEKWWRCSEMVASVVCLFAVSAAVFLPAMSLSVKALSSLTLLSVEAWALWGMFVVRPQARTRGITQANNIKLSPAGAVLVGWAIYSALRYAGDTVTIVLAKDRYDLRYYHYSPLVETVLVLVLGVTVRRWTSGGHEDIAFWMAATYFLQNVFEFSRMWIRAIAGRGLRLW